MSQTLSDGAPEGRPQPGVEVVDQPEEALRELRVAPVVGFLLVWLGVPWLVVGAWIQPLIPGGWWLVAAGLVACTLPVRTLVRGVRNKTYPSALTRLVVLRPFWYAMVFLPLLAVATLVGGLAGLPFGEAGSAGRWALAATVAVLTPVALLGYAATRRLVVKHLEVRMPRLPARFDGLRVVQISDLHVGPHTRADLLEQVARTVREQHPDLLVISGDQVDDFARDVDLFNRAFGALEAPLGVFAVAGNHDIYAGWDRVHRGLAEAGFTVLVNEAVPIEPIEPIEPGESDEASGSDERRLWIAGTGDPAGRGWSGGGARAAAPDVERTLAAVPPDEPVLAIAHNPALWPALAARGVDLTLSGHTHYGQLAIPRLGWSMASPFLKLAMGTHRQGRSLLYIHPGTNYWGIPFRLGTPPEVAVLTLTAGSGGEASLREPQAPLDR